MPTSFNPINTQAVTQYTTIAAWTLAIARALSVIGIEPKPIFQQVGLNIEVLEAKPDSRVDIAQMTQLWQCAMQATGSADFGLTVGRYAYPLHFHFLGPLLLSCNTLAEAFELLPDYSALVSNSGNIQLQRSPQWLGFTINPLNGVEISELAIDAFFSSLMQHGKQMLGHNQFVCKVELMRKDHKLQHLWQDYFGCEVVMNAATNCMWMDRTMLEQTTVTKNPQQAKYSEAAVRQYLQGMQALTWRQKTSQGIHVMLLEQEPTAQSIAKMYNVSERSLSRYLLQEGTSFRSLLKLKRQELACHYLLNTHIAVNELANILGYSSLSNFTRSFKGWLGVSPSQFRQQNLANKP
ncbi:AraC family transcriptional regulator [Shewanella pneumatophori]|uniref:AraC family transcriptional regulator n=1 Tax=Shewanella pneumatophori TaxID=314092 RepID=A0A9X2CEF6_9GAMM|nr:AraC family transcriptional regulator [Shewanella pneumatophori]MCL1140223.1 AraC family transcriptional regulator [Shewanella pneumatophori]